MLNSRRLSVAAGLSLMNVLSTALKSVWFMGERCRHGHSDGIETLGAGIP